MAKSNNAQVPSPANTASQQPTMTLESTEYTEYKLARSHPWSWVGRFFFRLFLLGLGGSLAAGVGVILALANPQPNSEKPLAIQAWEQLQALREQYWQEGSSSSETVVLPTANLANLSDTERQQLQIELDQLQTEFNSLGDRAQELEARVGLSQSDRPLSERFEGLEQALTQNSDTVTQTNSLVPSLKVKATLPKDVLFNPNNQLTDEATTVLDTIVEELQGYPGSTIRIGVHTDASENPALDRERSFQQGRTLEAYLKETLGDRYRFVTVGYGQAQPLAPNDTPDNRALNRRIEIIAE
jgi:outer membrane protein OmpA-like peptidoglycan-associated protein